MPKKDVHELEQRVRLTVHLTLTAYDAITELQRRYRTKEGRALPIWKTIDAAVRAYARQHDVEVKE